MAEKFNDVFEYIKREVNKSLAGAAIQLVKDLGLKDGDWGIQSNPHLERIVHGGDEVALWLKAWATALRHTTGFLPRSAGITGRKNGDSYEFDVDRARYDTCVKYGAMLAVHQVKFGKLTRVVPMTTGDVRNYINAATLAEYEKHGITLTDEQKARVKVDSQEMRRAMHKLEEFGFGFRGDQEGTPLTELRKTAEGAEKARKLSGEDKLSIYIYARPRHTGTLLSRHQDPAIEVAGAVKSLFRKVTRLGLEMDPKSFERDQSLQELLRRDEEEREALLRERDEALRSALIARGAVEAKVGKSCIPTSSKLQKPKGRILETQGISQVSAADSTSAEPPQAAAEPIRGRASSSDGRGREEEPVSKPRPTAVRQFHDALCRAFLEAGKPAPTPKQAEAILPRLNGHAEQFVDSLTLKKMSRVDHPGVLPSLVTEFLATYKASEHLREEARLQEEDADRRAAEWQARQPSEEQVRADLERAEREAPIRAELREVEVKLAAATKDLKAAGTSTIHIERAHKRLAKLTAEREGLLAKLEQRRPMDEETARHGAMRSAS